MTSGGAVSVKQREAITVAYLGRKGPYSQMGEAMGALFGGLAQKGLAPAGPPAATYYNVLGQVPEAKLLWEVWVPVGGSPPQAAAEGRSIGVKRLESIEVASTMHRGPYDQVGNTYATRHRWMAENGYKPTGPAEEVYLSNPAETPPEQLLTEVRLPVRKKA